MKNKNPYIIMVCAVFVITAFSSLSEAGSIAEWIAEENRPVTIPKWQYESLIDKGTYRLDFLWCVLP